MSAFAYWLLAGVVLLAIEAFGLPGVGLMFAGFGAFSVGVWLNVSPDMSLLNQFVVFFGTTTIWAGLLWKPLKKFRIGKTGGFSNIIGDTAFVSGSGLQKNVVGEASWSGTIMKAELSADAAVDALATGEQVTITAISGNTLIVKPKK
jgi:membrane protein implicated in regulation of membrane protease activity